MRNIRYASLTQESTLSQMTGNDPSRMAESAAINKSLSTLGQVVHALNKGAVSARDRYWDATNLSTDSLESYTVP